MNNISKLIIKTPNRAHTFRYAMSFGIIMCKNRRTPELSEASDHVRFSHFVIVIIIAISDCYHVVFRG